MAGAGVALLNSLVDVDRDRSAGIVTPAIRIGPTRARAIATGLLAIVAAGAIGSLVWIGAGRTAWVASLAGVALLALGIVLAGSNAAPRRERGWEASAIGLGLLAAGWALGFTEAGLL